MYEFIVSLLKGVWNLIRRIWVGIVAFTRHIVMFFRNPKILNELSQNRDAIAVSIKQQLETGDYEVVNCLFDRETNNLINPESDAEIISADDLDYATESKFGNKDMIVLH